MKVQLSLTIRKNVRNTETWFRQQQKSLQGETKRVWMFVLSVDIPIVAVWYFKYCDYNSYNT